jgi:hypothetical protein
MTEPERSEVDPVISSKFLIAPHDRVATAGSCFAQHISRSLAARGFNYFVSEGAPSTVQAHIAAKYNYGTFSARFGNIYTARQLVQLFDRAYGNFTPHEDPWERDGKLYDPFRPSVEIDGYQSLDHYEADLFNHFAAVRKMFESLDVFVFTLGLTEAWQAKSDGAVFPVAPGCGYGIADPEKYEFHNFTVAEASADMHAFIARLKRVNETARVIITVSPVPLVATYEPRHTLVSTTYSKSVLRVVAEELERSYGHVMYFPSYEIITGQHAQGAYYGPDLREVTSAGVDHVMRTFFRHMSAQSEKAPDLQPRAMVAREAVDIICDEELLVGGHSAKDNR